MARPQWAMASGNGCAGGNPPRHFSTRTWPWSSCRRRLAGGARGLRLAEHEAQALAAVGSHLQPAQ